MSYKHPKSGQILKSFNSHKEHCFYEETTKREMFLIIEQLANITKGKYQDWVDLATEERELLKINNIK